MFVGCVFVVVREEVLVWVGSMVMDQFGALLWFCGLWLSWSLRRRFVGCSLGRSEVVVWWKLRFVAKDTGLCAWLLVPVITSLAKGTSGPPSASREPLTVTFATAKGAVPNATDGILTLPLGHSNFGSYEPGGAPASQGKKTGVSRETPTHIEKEKP